MLKGRFLSPFLLLEDSLSVATSNGVSLLSAGVVSVGDSKQFFEDADHSSLVLVAIAFEQSRLVGRGRRAQYGHGDAQIGGNLSAADQSLCRRVSSRIHPKNCS